MPKLPFPVDESFGVFRAYNDAVWPMQWVLGLGMATAALAASRLPSKNRWINGIRKLHCLAPPPAPRQSLRWVSYC